MMNKEIYTIGHSTHPAEEFLNMLDSFGITMLVDIRRHPGSKRYPQFNQVNLKEMLNNHYIGYKHIEELGGRRKVEKNSNNTGWKNLSFRGYADYMETKEFESGVEMLEGLALQQKTVFMCSEAVWWSCHRALVSDYLKLHGWKVWHIMAVHKAVEHPYTSVVKIKDGKLDYTENTLFD